MRWIGRVSLVVAAALLAACPSSDPVCSGAATHVRVNATGTPAFFAVSDGNGEWESPGQSDASGYDLCVVDDFVIVAVCADDAGRFATQQIARTPEDGTELSLDPCDSPGSSKEVVSVSGDVKQPALVTLGGASQLSIVSPWMFSLSVYVGTYDLVASNDYYDIPASSRRVLLRRDQRISQTSSVGVLDLDADGVETTSLPLAITGLNAGDRLTVSTSLSTSRTGNGLPFEIATLQTPEVHLLPSSALRAIDRQFLSVLAVGGRFARHNHAEFVGGLAVDLLPTLPDVVLLATEVQWTSLPVVDFSGVDYFLSGNSGRQRLSATNAWLQVHGASSLTLVTGVPGFDSQWTVATARSRTFQLNQTRDEVQRSSIVSELVQ